MILNHNITKQLSLELFYLLLYQIYANKNSSLEKFLEFKNECIKLTWKKLLYHLECLTRIRKGTFFLFIYLLCDYLSMCQSSTYFLSYANSFCASRVYFQKCLLKNGGMDPLPFTIALSRVLFANFQTILCV